MATQSAEFTGPDGTLRVELLPDGRHQISVQPKLGYRIAVRSWVTAYPIELIRIIHTAKGLFVCDEIMREESSRYVERSLRHEVLAYVDRAAFAGKRILDFGCGSGASTLVLNRRLPPCEIVGVEVEGRLIDVARARTRHLGRAGVEFLQSPSGDRLPPDLGTLDFVVFSAVFEHLLPHERLAVLTQIWSHLRSGGVLFLNQTPYRYAPIEMHTTGGVPLINYLPDGLALRMARACSSRVSATEDWDTLLRRGIRGGTVPEILTILGGARHAELLTPLPPLRDRIDLWYRMLSRRHAWLKCSIWGSLKVVRALTGKQITPSLALAIRKR